MSSFEFRLLLVGAGLVPMIGWATSWWMGVSAGILYAIAATIILRPVVRQAREAREQAKRTLPEPKDWQGRKLEGADSEAGGSPR